MPYSNIPKSKTKKMERCVASVKKSNPNANPYAVCYDSLMGKLKKNFKNKKI